MKFCRTNFRITSRQYSDLGSTFIFVFLLYCVLVFMIGCIGDETPAITADVDACAHCNMVISQINQSCGYFVENEFIPFDSPGCLLTEYEKLKKQGKPKPGKIYFADYTTSRFIISDSVYFLLTEHIPTIMNAGVLTFYLKDLAESFKKFSEEIITDWTGYQVLHGTPDRIIEITISPEGMDPDVIVLNKNEIVEWIFQAKGLQKEYLFHLKGYDEFGIVTLSTKNKPVKIRMLADKPGAGFPFVSSETETPIGMVKVFGAHTSDEEAM